MKLVDAVSALLDVTTAGLTLFTKAMEISQLIQKVQMEGREISDEEWKTITGMDDAARKRLQDAIEKAADQK